MATEPSPWKTIDDSTPRDGSYVDLWYAAASGPGHGITYRRIPDCRWLADETTPGWYADSRDGAYFLGNGAIDVGDDPTHWMPRPESPL